jgi:DNA-binding transcriptional regulator YiaG
MDSIKIKELRKALNMSQESLARTLGVSFQTVNRWESEKRKPSPLALEKLTHLLNKENNNVKD